jgi:hypothetical protein
MIRAFVLILVALSILAAPMIARAEIGICCFADGSCIQVEEQDCWDFGGCAFFPGAE